MIHVNWNIDAGSILVSTGLGAVGYGLRMLYSLGKEGIGQFKKHGEMIDVHSDIFEREGLAQDLPRVHSKG